MANVDPVTERPQSRPKLKSCVVPQVRLRSFADTEVAKKKDADFHPPLQRWLHDASKYRTEYWTGAEDHECTEDTK